MYIPVTCVSSECWFGHRDMCDISMFLGKVWYISFTYTYAFSIVKMLVFWHLIYHLLLQLTLVISTPLISILSLMSNWFLSPDYFPYVFIVFQLRVCRTSFMSTLRLSRPSFSVPEYIFHSFYYRVSRTRTMTKEKNIRCGAAGLSVNENHNRPLICGLSVNENHNRPLINKSIF